MARLARLADAACLGLLCLALLIDLTGGFRVGRDWYRLSLKDPIHVAEVALALALVRHLVVRRPSLRDRLRLRRERLASDTGLYPVTWRDAGVAAAVMVGVTILLLHDQVFMLTGVPDRGDPLLSMWMLAWVAHQIVRNPLHLFDGNMFYPATDTLAYSDATLLPGLIASPFLWAGVPLAVVNGGLYVLSFVLGGVTMFALALAVTGKRLPALIAAIAFSFAPYRISNYSHLQMQGVWLMPLAMLFLLRVLRSGGWRDGVWLGVSAGAQTLWSFYLGAYLAVGLALTAAVRWVAGHFQIRRRLGALAVAGIVGAAIVGPYSMPYWRTRALVGERPRDEIRTYSAKPRDYLDINEMNVLWGRFMRPDSSAERQLFPGLAPVALSLVALAPPAAPIAAAAAVGALVAFDASLGFNGAAFTWLYDVAPPFHAFRVPARFAALVGLFLALGAAVGLARLSDWSRTSLAARVAFAVLGTLAVVEVRPALQLRPLTIEPPPIYGALASDPDAVIVDVPLPPDDSAYEVDPVYLYYSTFHWHRLLNGYSGFTPPWYSRLMVASRELPSDESVAAFRKAGAQYLVLHEEFCAPGQFADIARGLDARADLRLVTSARSPQGESRLYRFAGSAPGT